MDLKERKKYFKTIKKLLPIYGEKEKKFLADLDFTVNEYMDRNPSCTAQDIEQHFSSPQNVVAEYINALDTDYLAKHLKRTHLIRMVFCAAFALLLCSFCIHTYLDYQAYLDFNNAIPIFIEEIIEVEPETPTENEIY